MKYFINNKNVRFHLIFIFILSSYYLIPYILVGHLILKSHDILDMEIVYNHVIGKIYRGDFESIKLFLAGELEWYFLRRIFQPLTVLYAIFQTETAFWLTDIIIKLTSYICFFILSRKLNCSPFNSALIACLFASSMDAWTHFGLGIATFPYLIYLIIKNKNFNLKHYFILAFIGLNTDLVGDILILPLLFFISWIFLSESQKKYNYKLFFKISFILIFFIILSNSNIIYSILFAGPFHRAEFVYEGTNLTSGLKNLIKNFFLIPDFNISYFFHKLPFTFYVFPIIIISLFSKNKLTYLLLAIVLFVKSFDFILNLELLADLRNSAGGLIGFLIKSIHWGYMMHALPVLYGLLFISISKTEILRKFKYLTYALLFLSLITFQMRISVIPLGKYFISFNNFSNDQKNQLRESFHNQKYLVLIRDVYKFKKDSAKIYKKDFKSLYTFEGYYDYENYKYIKSYVNDSRTVSVGLDPMVAVMNNIKVVDGYHNLYPLSYKSKFRKIIEEQLEENKEFKKYYDNYGQRVYTFVYDPQKIKVDFFEAKKLGAHFVISKYPISNQILTPVCEKCNDSPDLFLYKIEI